MQTIGAVQELKHIAVSLWCNFLIIIPYSRKIWQGIKFGGLAVYVITAKLKSAKISYLHIYNIIHMAIPYRTAKFEYTNILAIAILGSTAKLNSSQYLRLYGNY